MQLIDSGPRVPQANARLVDLEAFKKDLAQQFSGELRFDRVSRALYSTDASVYEIWPLGVAIPATRDDLLHVVRTCWKHRCPYTMRGGGTSQGGQSIGEGLNVDLSKSFTRVLELNVAERWVRVEPGLVLDELNQQLAAHGLRFAPDVSTANRATIGGMIANNSSGARSVLYGKTIDHVLELEVAFSDGSVALLRELDSPELDAACEGDSLAAQCHRVARDLGRQHAEEVRARFPNVMRRVMGYNLDEFTGGRLNLAKLITGSEGTLAVILSAKLNLVPLPKAKSVLTIQFDHLLDSLAATPAILKHGPSAIEVMDGGILANTKQSPAFARLASSFIQGDPGSLLCVEFYGDTAASLSPRMQALEAEMRATTTASFFCHATDAASQQRIWGVREAALGFSMAMKEDAKSISFVEDTAVAPERLRDFIDRFQALLTRHGTTAGIYAHASVGCLHVRPVINLKTEEGVERFSAIAHDVADLVLEFGGALSGEHGDGLVRSPFIRKMFGPVLYEAFREIKRTFDPRGVLNPGKICDPPALTANLRYGAGYQTPNPSAWFDWSEYGGLGGAVDMCSGVAACRKQRGGTMCPSYMATHEEQDSTRGRANMLRLAMNGRLGESGLGDEGVYQTLDLCLECRACKAECPVGVDVARFKSEFLADYYQRHGTPREAKLLGHARRLAELGAQAPALTNWLQPKFKGMAGIDARRSLPKLAAKTLATQWPGSSAEKVLFFNDTWTNFYDPEIGLAVRDVLARAGLTCGVAPNACCGRPLISKGLMAEARAAAERNVELLAPVVANGARLVFAEPSCLSVLREDAPALLRGASQQKAREIAKACLSFEELMAGLEPKLPAKAAKVVLHGHCHQKAMGLLAPAKAIFARVDGVELIDPDAGCCGMAGSFGYTHYELSRDIAERRLLPAVRAAGVEVVAAGTSCRHQIRDLAGIEAVHPAVWLRRLMA